MRTVMGTVLYRPGPERRRMAPRLAALCTVLCALAGVPATASASTAGPRANFPEQIAPVCTNAPRSIQCTQAGIIELDAARAQEGQVPYRLPSDFLKLSGAHQIVVLTNLDREADGLRVARGTTAALDRVALTGALANTDPVLTDSSLPWSANWAGAFPSAVWAYLTWMYDDGFGGPNIDCQTPGANGCWGHRDDILARFPRGGTLEMGAADVSDRSYAMVIAQSLAATPVRFDFRFAAR